MSDPRSRRSVGVLRIIRRAGSILPSRPPLIMVLAIVAAAMLVVGVAIARPGGGHSYSGGGGSSSGSGGDSDGLVGLFLILLQLCFEHPVIGIPLMAVFLGFVGINAAVKARRGKYKDWEAGAGVQPTQQAAQPAAAHASTYQRPGLARMSPRAALEAIRGFDQNFSTVLFEDFLYSLYAEVQRARGGNNLQRLSAYLTPEAAASLAGIPAAEVGTVIVGAMRVVNVMGVSQSDAFVQVAVEFEANYTERTHPQGQPVAFYVVEQWHVARRHGALSRAPGQANIIACPSCGAPLDLVMAGRCSHCGNQVNNGNFDWTVRGIQLLRREPRGPMLTSDTPEQGNELPTIYDPNAQAAFQALSARDPQFRWDAFQARVGLIFSEFQTAWSARDLASMRPFLSDNLFQTQAYWIEAYKAQRLRNVTERARITGLELVKVASDRFFDSITLRVRASSLDYTVTEDGSRVVSGSRSRERVYSEYWTLIRGTGRSGPTRTDRSCPNCGAPLKINMAGHCEYCGAKVTTGEFDWVLSRIEQDESYQG